MILTNKFWANYFLVFFVLFFAHSFAFCQQDSSLKNLKFPGKKANKVLLPNGWSLSAPGRFLPLGDLPLNMALSNNKKMLSVTNNGQSEQFIQLIDPKNEKLLDQVTIDKAWYGIKFSDDDKTLYVSGGNDNCILTYAIKNNKLSKPDSLILGKAWPSAKISPTGIDVDNQKSVLYTVTKEDNSLYIVDLKTKQVAKKNALKAEAYACLLNPDKTKLYISLWGGDKLLVYNTATNKFDAEIATGSHPNEILTTQNGKYIYVANANDNSVTVISSSNNTVIETISASLYPTKLTGSTTNGLALANNDKTLYIANADNNCLAVFDVSNPGKSLSKGFIPTGWYPTSIKTINDKILVSNGKGFSSMANPKGPQPVKATDNSGVHTGVIGNKKLQYIGGLFKGTLSFIDQPNEEKLKQFSKEVYENTPYKPEQERASNEEENNPIPKRIGDKSPIKHVFYIIKENRTYDQMLGDMKEGNGDPSLCLFPEKITPNHHALAREFVLLDNFYVDAEVSADGHNWSMAAYATDYVEKTWPISYGKRGDAGSFTGKSKIGAPKDGFIWDYCKRAGVTYRSYGEFGDKGKANISALNGFVCKDYPSFNLDFKDVDRFKIFKKDFDSLLAAGTVPQFLTIRLPNDHTSGQKKGHLNPYSAVGDNDLALGQMIECISNSSIWKESAIFVLEDDAQNGPDHVDAHRSIAYVISPFVKRGTVNSTMYSTSGFLRTMELILGLPPMSQYDAAATPASNCFTLKADFSPYVARPANIPLDVYNTANNKSSKKSEKFNFNKEDDVPDLELNDVVWKFVKGEDSVMPAPKRSAFVKLEKKKKDDD